MKKRFPNVKVGGARNIGLDASNGEYVLFVDADDFLREDMVEVLYKNAVSNDADIARCGNYTYFGNIRLGSYYSSSYKEDKRIIRGSDRRHFEKNIFCIKRKLIIII